MKKTKIVATIGPASESLQTLENMAKSGMDVCRLNFSHGDHAWHKKAIATIRKAEKKIGRKIGIMADIQGPRIRTANKESVEIIERETVIITDELHYHQNKKNKEIILDIEGFFQYLKKDSLVYIEDGMIILKVVENLPYGAKARVVFGGRVDSHKGVNIPSASAKLGFLTEKDLRDLKFILSEDVDFIAASFVGSEKDLVDLRRIATHFLPKTKKELPWIISKIERKSAVRNLEKIIKESDGIMVARGDLAIEMPQERVGILQKDIIQECLKRKKPVIVATQMMASMVEKIRPTRAEISDVTNAVVDHADAVMFSNETATGRNPLATIETAKKIITATEKSNYDDVPLRKRNFWANILREKREEKNKVVRPKNLKELLEFSSLRQEEITIKPDFETAIEERRARLIWG